jgi:ATP-binding cassette subfamily C protein
MVGQTSFKTGNGGAELRHALRGGRSFIVAVFIFSLLVNALMLVGPLFMLQVYDRVLASGSEATLLALFLLVAGLYALMAVLDFARGRLLARVGARFEEALEERVMRASLLRAVHTSERAGPASGLNDMNAIPAALSSPGFLALFDLPWAPFFFALLFVFHPLMGWLGIAGGVVLLALTLINQLTTRKNLEKQNGLSRHANTFAEQSRRAAEIVRSQGLTGTVVSRWSDMRYKAALANMSYSDLSGLFQAFTKAFRLFLQSAMLALGAWLVLKGQLSPGAMIAGSIILGRALAPIEQSLGQWRNLQGALSAWKSLAALLGSTPPEQRRTELPVPEARLTIKELVIRSPGSDKITLSVQLLDIVPGQALGVIGRSGSGKSSLVKTLVGLWHPVAGEVRLGGARLDQYDPEVLGTYIGYLPQDLVFFTGSIAQNIARMSTDPDEAAVIRAAKAARAHELILSLPKGYDSVIEGGGIELSGGQRQRVALARALYSDPQLLVLDEPNSALDDEGAQALNLVIRQMKEAGKIVVVTTHRPAAMSEVDRVMIINNGQVAAEGPMEDVIKALMAGNAQKARQPLQESKLNNAS